MSGARVFRALIMGAPGSGKGTISERIVKQFGLKHLSSGDLLRAQTIAKTDIGLEVQQYIDKGHLVPDDTMVSLISAELKKLSGHSWLLDGFPRTRVQAEALHQVHPLDSVINLEVPFQVIVDRIKDRWVHLPSGRIYNTLFNPPRLPFTDDVTGERLVQRPDDAPDAVRRRLEVYQAEAGPVLEFYQQLGLLKTFTGTETNKIWPHVQAYLQRAVGPQ